MGKRYREMLRDVAAMPPGLAPALRIEGPDGTATADDAVPTAFTWRDQRYRVRAVLGRWREDRAWTIDPSATDWLGEGATTSATPATRATPAPAVTSATTAATAPTTMATETSATTAATTVTRSATTAATTATRSATTTATPAATTPAATPTGSTATGSTATTATTATTPAASTPTATTPTATPTVTTPTGSTPTTPTATTPAATTPAAATRTAPGAAVGRLVLGAASDVREHWRVEAIGPRGVGVYELCRRGEQWRLERVWD